MGLRALAAVCALLTVGMITGCGARGSGRAAQTPNEVFAMMDAELGQTLDSSSIPVGTTTLTSATLDAPIQLPQGRGSLSELREMEEEPVVQTWGAPPEPVTESAVTAERL